MVDWSKYYAEEEEEVKGDAAALPPTEEPTALQEQPIQQPETQEAVQEPIDWNKYYEGEDPSILQEAGRHVARLGSRIGEQFLGFPGSVVQMTKWVDSKLPKPPKFLQTDPNFLQKKSREALESLPTPNDLKEKVSEITSGFTDPEGAIEEFGDDIIELASALMIGKDPRKVKSLVAAIGKSAVAKVAGKKAELLGAEEKGQFAAEMGTLFLMDFINPGMANKFVRDKYNKAAGLIPKSTMLNTSGITRELQLLENELGQGLSTASKNEVSSAVSELRSKMSGGASPAHELVEAFHDVNERMSSKKLFGDLSKGERRSLRYRYNKLKKILSSEIESYGKSNPEFYKEWQEANQSFSTIQDSRKATSFLERKVGSLPSHVASGMAIELFFGHPNAALATGAGYVAMKTGELLYRVAKSPPLRKHYLGVLEAAAKENTPAMANSLSKLDEGLKRSFAEEDDE